MLDPLPELVDLIIANLPYVKESELARTQALHFEPALALNGGHDGLEKIYKLAIQIGEKLHPGGRLLLEIGKGQSRAVTAFLSRLFPRTEVEMIKDLSGTARVISMALPSVKDMKESSQGHAEAHIDKHFFLPATSN
jgi:release factor glutamine methyltransferase